jgi:hypothetical protein
LNEKIAGDVAPVQPAARGDVVRMPRYFFHIRIAGKLLVDPQGKEMPDPDHAWTAARATIVECLAIQGDRGKFLSAILEVTDEAGELVLEFPFSEVIIDASKISGTKH